jgi:transcriptional regulator with XRE-family HTH domain
MMGKHSRRPNPQHDAGYVVLRERLKALREAAGLTQVELGAAFRRPHTFVHKVESGDRRIDPVEFCRWCLVCGADPSQELQAVSRIVKRTPPL